MRKSTTHDSSTLARRAPGPWRLALTAVASVLLLAPVASRQLTVIRVAAGQDLQAAIAAARPGDVILLESGALFTGNFELPNHGDTPSFITIRTEAEGLPRGSERTGPQFASKLATLQSPNAMPALRTAPGAHHWRIENLAFGANATGTGDVIALGNGSRSQNSIELVPHSLVLDRLLMAFDAAPAQKRGIALNSASTEIRNSHISGVRVVGQDSQAIAGWNGPGPYRIDNNYLEAASENILFGGADPALNGLIPTDIVIRRNHFSKSLSWRTGRWNVKNLLELKNARAVQIEGNVFDYNWHAAQDGYALVFKPENQDGGAPWTNVENVRFTNNVVRHVSGAIAISGMDTRHPSARLRNLVVANNLFLDVNSDAWGGTGDFIKIGNAPADVVIEDNTVINDGRIINVYGARGDAQIEGFVFRRNVVRHNTYGVKGASTAAGQATLDRYFPGAIFVDNVIATDRPRRYPDGNRLVSEHEVHTEAVFPGAGVNLLLLETALGASTIAPATLDLPPRSIP